MEDDYQNLVGEIVNVRRKQIDKEKLQNNYVGRLKEVYPKAIHLSPCTRFDGEDSRANIKLKIEATENGDTERLKRLTYAEDMEEMRTFEKELIFSVQLLFRPDEDFD